MTTRQRQATGQEPRVSGDDLLEQIDPVRRRVDTYVCLSGDLLDDWETENNELGRLQAEELQKKASATSQRLASANTVSAKVKKQAEKVKALEELIEQKQLHFVFESLNPTERSALQAEHPPRKGDHFDALAGYDREAVTQAQVRACCVEPVFSDAGWERLMSVIPPGEWDELITKANEANGRVAALPKSGLAARLLQGRSVSSSRSAATGE